MGWPRSPRHHPRDRDLRDGRSNAAPYCRAATAGRSCTKGRARCRNVIATRRMKRATLNGWRARSPFPQERPPYGPHGRKHMVTAERDHRQRLGARSPGRYQSADPRRRHRHDGTGRAQHGPCPRGLLRDRVSLSATSLPSGVPQTGRHATRRRPSPLIPRSSLGLSTSIPAPDRFRMPSVLRHLHRPGVHGLRKTDLHPGFRSHEACPGSPRGVDFAEVGRSDRRCPFRR